MWKGIKSPQFRSIGLGRIVVRCWTNRLPDRLNTGEISLPRIDACDIGIEKTDNLSHCLHHFNPLADVDGEAVVDINEVSTINYLPKYLG